MALGELIQKEEGEGELGRSVDVLGVVDGLLQNQVAGGLPVDRLLGVGLLEMHFASFDVEEHMLSHESSELRAGFLVEQSHKHDFEISGSD